MASIRRFSPTNPKIVWGKEHATAGGFKAGDLVKFTSGQVQIATASGSRTIQGIALDDASGTENTEIAVELLNYDDLYEVTYKASGTAQSLVGALIDCTVFTAGAHTWDESGATTDAVCVQLIDAANTTSGKILVRFLPALA